jgi:nucleoside-diphosphate-sugar epimerase
VLETLFGSQLASNQLRLFEAPLIIEGDRDGAIANFRRAFADTKAVFHTASPFTLSYDGIPDAQKAYTEMVDPALEGTRNVLQACMDCRVPRVILTSSGASVQWRPEGPTRVDGSLDDLPAEEVTIRNNTFSEKDWSSVEWLTSQRMWYSLSKTLAETCAWNEFPELDLRVVNPTLVLGPLLTAHLNESHKRLLEFLDGTFSEIPNRTTGLVHVLDVVDAHIACLETDDDDASGRHVCVSESLHWKDVVDMLRQVLTDMGLTDKVILPVCMTPEDKLAQPKTFDSRKTERLIGRRFIGLYQILRDSVEGMIQQGLWSPT